MNILILKYVILCFYRAYWLAKHANYDETLCVTEKNIGAVPQQWAVIKLI